MRGGVVGGFMWGGCGRWGLCGMGVVGGIYEGWYGRWVYVGWVW